jgi:hypothetical protein
MKQLIKCGLPPIPKNTLTNILAKNSRLKNKQNLTTSKKATPNDILKWCEKNSKIPDDEDLIFVGKYEVRALPEQHWRIFLTSRRLISFSVITIHDLAGNNNYIF